MVSVESGTDPISLLILFSFLFSRWEQSVCFLWETKDTCFHWETSSICNVF